MFVVADTALRYLRPARLDDLLEITVAVAEAGRASLRLQQQAWCGGELLAEGGIRIGCVAVGRRSALQAQPHSGIDTREDDMKPPRSLRSLPPRGAFRSFGTAGRT